MSQDQSYGALIEKTLRILTPTIVEPFIQVIDNYTAGSGTLTVDANSPAYAMIGRPGTLFEVGLNMLITQYDNGSGVLSVLGGQQGSTDANITGSCTASTATAWISPKFSRFDIGVAINDELGHLSGPDVGLGQILAADVTYIPAFLGYNLPTTFDPVTSKVLEVTYAEPLPWLRNPLIRFGDYRVIRNQDTSSGYTNPCGIILYKAAWPGMPVRVQYLSPFSTLVNLTDDLLSVAGVPAQMQDIVAMGAALRLAPDREIQRNTLSMQPDPRKATEVPAGAQMSAANNLMARYFRRINAEAARIDRAYPEAEW